jgi:hypothetical protein
VINIHLKLKQMNLAQQMLKTNLNDIFVVPNPYVVFSNSEQPGRTAEKRGDRQLQFRNLPPTCTIRIYTLTGELVQKYIKMTLAVLLTGIY